MGEEPEKHHAKKTSPKNPLPKPLKDQETTNEPSVVIPPHTEIPNITDDVNVEKDVKESPPPNGSLAELEKLDEDDAEKNENLCMEEDDLLDEEESFSLLEESKGKPLTLDDMIDLINSENEEEQEEEFKSDGSFHSTESVNTKQSSSSMANHLGTLTVHTKATTTSSRNVKF